MLHTAPRLTHNHTRTHTHTHTQPPPRPTSAPFPPQAAENLHGTPEAPITITSAAAASPPRQVIDGANAPASNGPPLFGRPYMGLLSCYNCSHVVIAGLEMRNANPCNGSNVVIDPRGDWFPERGLCGAGVAVLEGNAVVVEDVYVHDVGVPRRDQRAPLLVLALVARACVLGLWVASATLAPGAGHG